MLTRNCLLLKHGVAVKKSKSFGDAAEELENKFFTTEKSKSDERVMEED